VYLYDHTWRSDDIRVGQRDFEHRCDIEQMVSFDDSNGRQTTGEHPVHWIVIVDVRPNVGASTSASLDTHGATIVGGLHMELIFVTVFLSQLCIYIYLKISHFFFTFFSYGFSCSTLTLPNFINVVLTQVLKKLIN
jgi:hypothetical protein